MLGLTLVGRTDTGKQAFSSQACFWLFTLGVGVHSGSIVSRNIHIPFSKPFKRHFVCVLEACLATSFLSFLAFKFV